MYEHHIIPPFNDFLDFTAVLPKFYWNVYSAEQRIHEICKCIGKLVAYADAINEHANNLDDAFVNWNEKLTALDEYAHELENKFDAEQIKQTVELKEYTDAQVLALDIALRELISNISIDNIPVLDPEDSESYKSLDEVLQYNYNNLRYLAASAKSYDNKEFSAQEYDDEQLSAYKFDFYSTCDLLNGTGLQETFDGSYYLAELDRMIGEGSTADIREQVEQNTSDIATNTKELKKHTDYIDNIGKKINEIDELDERQEQELDYLGIELRKSETETAEALEEVRQSIATNTDNITTNTTNITTNTSDIAELDTRVDTIEPQVTTNTSDIANLKYSSTQYERQINSNSQSIETINFSANWYTMGLTAAHRLVSNTTGFRLNTETEHKYTSEYTGKTYYGSLLSNSKYDYLGISNVKWYSDGEYIIRLEPNSDALPQSGNFPHGAAESEIDIFSTYSLTTRYTDYHQRLISFIKIKYLCKTGTVTGIPQTHAVLVSGGSIIGDNINNGYRIWQKPSATSNDFFTVEFIYPFAAQLKSLNEYKIGYAIWFNEDIEYIDNIEFEFMPARYRI